MASMFSGSKQRVRKKFSSKFLHSGAAANAVSIALSSG